MFKDNRDFYPTPENIIEKMLVGINFDYIFSILEPSAGSGNIADFLEKKKANKNAYKQYSYQVDCVEKDQKLQHILKGKNHRVVHDDFLTYDTMKEYDLIIMNPPFSNGCKHMLKALELQERNGGGIVCLLNAETLKNPYTNERIVLKRKLAEYNAEIQYIKNSFSDSERKTNVEIALIKVKLPEVKRESFIINGLKKAQELREKNEEYQETHLAENNFFSAIVNQYKMEVEAGKKLIEEYYAMAPYIMREFGKDTKTGEIVQTGGCILKIDLTSNYKRYSNHLSVNAYICEVRKKYWTALFNNPQFIGQLTGNLRNEFQKKVEELKDYEFSLYNICQLKIDMQKKVVKGIEDTIISLFEELSNIYHWFNETSNNIHYYNGWKTNKSWIINKKVIIPLQAWKDLDYSWGGFKPTSRNVLEKLTDIEKCFNYLDGGLTDAIDLEESLKFAEEYEESKNIALKYFSVTFYKKGTCHIVFNNEELLKKFNIFGSQHKGWLPPCYGKKNYKDMTKEEKEVIDEFEGEKSYKETMNNKKYFLFDGNNLNLLEIKE